MATVIYKCKNCGGPVKYSATLGKFNCEYCNTVYTEEEVKNLSLMSQDEDVVEDGDNGEYLEYHCPSCGANIVTDETTVATTCLQKLYLLRWTEQEPLNLLKTG